VESKTLPAGKRNTFGVDGVSGGEKMTKMLFFFIFPTKKRKGKSKHASSPRKTLSLLPSVHVFFFKFYRPTQKNARGRTFHWRFFSLRKQANKKEKKKRNRGRVSARLMKRLLLWRRVKDAAQEEAIHANT
jgi:hypothetical protein